MNETKILAVDDEPGILSNVRAYLEREGYVVQTAQDGASALRLARSFSDVIGGAAARPLRKLASSA